MAKSDFKDKIMAEMYTELPTSREEVLAYLSAAGKAAGSIEYRDGRINFILSVTEQQEAMTLVSLFKSVYPTEFELGVPKKNAKKNNHNFTVAVPSLLMGEVLCDLGLVTMEGESYTSFTDAVPERFKRKKETASSYLKGLFSVVGNVYVPSVDETDEKKAGYHFEYSLSSEDFATSVCELLHAFGIKAKQSERSQSFLVYLKDKDEILDMLGVLGLHDTALTLKGIIDEREITNSINRAVICEAANLDKTYAAAAKQLRAIGVIEEKYGLETLSPELYETAQARMSAEKASMSELAEMLSVTKSCLNHRLRRLIEISEDVTFDESDDTDGAETRNK